MKLEGLAGMWVDKVLFMSTDPSNTRYADSIVEHYDRDYGILRPSGLDVDFYTDLALHAGGPAMEIGCGTGRVCLPIARAGCTVTGVDPTAGMLDLFRHKLALESADLAERVTLREGCFSSVPGEGSFALVFSAFRAFQHLVTREAQIAALAEMARWTAPGGLVAFDVFDYDVVRAAEYVDEHADYVLELGEQLRERRSKATFNSQQRLIHCRFRWLLNGAPDGEATFSMKVSTRDELVDLLPLAGLELIAVFGSFDGTPWTAERRGEIVIVARRPNSPRPSADAP
ncbi:MAG: SAM-dependent methyltransferase [Pseudohongiellaceae bacterium]|jgi:SAM-dependent methyltransferase